MKSKVMQIALIIASFSALADEIQRPRFKGTPEEYVSRHQIAYRWDGDRAEQVEDVLVIGDVTSKNITFYVKTIGNNHHTCQVAGNAERDGEQYVFRYQQCNLRITFDAKAATVSDPDDECQKRFCGAMAHLNSDFTKK